MIEPMNHIPVRRTAIHRILLDAVVVYAGPCSLLPCVFYANATPRSSLERIDLYAPAPNSQVAHAAARHASFAGVREEKQKDRNKYIKFKELIVVVIKRREEVR